MKQIMIQVTPEDDSVSAQNALHHFAALITIVTFCELESVEEKLDFFQANSSWRKRLKEQDRAC